MMWNNPIYPFFRTLVRPIAPVRNLDYNPVKFVKFVQKSRHA